ncbi:hypothetical protein ACWV2X_23155 [Streptomyces hydrogenans]
MDAHRDRLKSVRVGAAPEPVRGLYAQEIRHARVTLTTVVGIAITDYVTLRAQAAFPLVLLGRPTCAVLAVLLGMRIGIAVLMGLPLFRRPR